jgi:hypothetical protein
MQIAVLKERTDKETRVALVPESVKKLVALKAVVTVESEAGLSACASDEDYKAAGAIVSKDRAHLIQSADVLVTVNRPAEDDFYLLKTGAVLFGFLRPLDEPAAFGPAVTLGLTVFAVELIPRIARAQHGRTFDGDGRWLQSGCDGGGTHAAHVSDADDCGRNGSARTGVGDWRRRCRTPSNCHSPETRGGCGRVRDLAPRWGSGAVTLAHFSGSRP